MAIDAAPAVPAAAGAPDRWRVATWSGVLPGLGQFALGEAALGAVLLTLAALGSVGFALSILVGRFPLAPGFLGLVVTLACSIASIVLAYRQAEPAGNRAPASAWKAVFWSRLLPGLGQILERRHGHGFAYLAVALVATQLGDGLLEGTVWALAGTVAVLDAWLGSRAPRTHAPEAPRTLAAVVGLMIAGSLIPPLIRAEWSRAFRFPGGSMEPTIRAGDYFLADVSRRGRASAGDLIVYRDPANPAHDFCKRCVAVEGEKLELRDRQLWIGGRPVAEPFVFHTDPAIRPGGSDPRDNFGPYTVPPGHVFVLGDNRENSNDSRYWGPLPLSHVRGRATKVYWPPWRWRDLPHGSG